MLCDCTAKLSFYLEGSLVNGHVQISYEVSLCILDTGRFTVTWQTLGNDLTEVTCHLSFSVLKRTLFFIYTYLAVTICDKSGIFSGKLYLNVPAELRENWDRNDLSLPLVPKLPMLPELSEPFRRSVEGTLPQSEDSTSSVKQIRKYLFNIL